MTYEELKIINFGNPSRELLEKMLSEYNGRILNYKAMYADDRRNYWKGKIGQASKVKKEIERRIQKLNLDE